MNITEDAVDAAAAIGEHHAGVFQYAGCREHLHEDSFECVAGLMLEAAAPFLRPTRADIAKLVLEHWPQEYIDPRYPAAFRCAAAGCEWHGRFAGDIAEHVADLLTTGRET